MYICSFTVTLFKLQVYVCLFTIAVNKEDAHIPWFPFCYVPFSKEIFSDVKEKYIIMRMSKSNVGSNSIDCLTRCSVLYVHVVSEMYRILGTVQISQSKLFNYLRSFRCPVFVLQQWRTPTVQCNAVCTRQCYKLRMEGGWRGQRSVIAPSVLPIRSLKHLV